MAFLRAKPIGVMGMIDQGEQDDKVCTSFMLSPSKHDTAVAAVCLVCPAMQLPVHIGHATLSRTD